ncbi:MAG: hypothetical protein WCW26_03970, partial [Candidatus Buchananbacteria bacterium]
MLNQEITKKYKDLNWNELLRKDLGNYSLEEAKPILDRIKNFFDSILLSTEINNFAQGIQNEIQNQITNFLNYCNNSLKTFSDIGQKQQRLEEIK